MRGQTKVRATHLDRIAVIYVRQSTLAQVREHTESTMRQVRPGRGGHPAELGRRRGRGDRRRPGGLGALGRGPGRVQGFGRPGVSGRDRRGVRVGDPPAGPVIGGPVPDAGAARLTDTLVIDADGIYDLADFNDRLLLGLKGTMSEAELHLLAGRLQGAKRAAAARASCAPRCRSATSTTTTTRS